MFRKGHMMSENSENKIENVVERAAKPRRWTRRLGIAFLTILLFGAAFWWFFLRCDSLTVSPETTHITGPLTADGSVDYFAYLESRQPKNIATDENGYRVLLREMGLSPYQFRDDNKNVNKDAVDQFFQKLDLTPVYETLMPLEDNSAAWKNWNKAKSTEWNEEREFRCFSEIQDQTQWFATLDDDKRAFLAEFFDKNTPALDLIVRESAKKTFAVPVVRTVDSGPLFIESMFSLEVAQDFRHWARQLRFRALWRVIQGDIDGAIEDRLAIHRLGWHILNPEGSLVQGLIGIALEGIAFGTPVGDNPDHQPTAEQWQRLLDAFEEYPIVGKPTEWLEVERLFALDALQRWSDGDRTSFLELSDPASPWPSNFFGADYNRMACKFNQYYDEMIANVRASAPCGPMLETISAESKNTPYTLFSRAKRSDAYAASLFCLAVPAMDAACEANRRIQCVEQMAKINIALELYRCEHDGKLPPAFTVNDDNTQDDHDGQRAVADSDQTAQGTPKKIHSWRTLILPYLGYQELFAQIKLDEPWDSAWNKQFHQRNIPEFICPSARIFQERRGECAYPKSGETTYSVIVGPETLFPGSEGIDPAAVERENPERKALLRLLVVERCDPILWMKPDAELTQEIVAEGVNFDPEAAEKNQPKKHQPNRPGSYHPSGMNTAIGNGAAQFISEAAEEIL